MGTTQRSDTRSNTAVLVRREALKSLLGSPPAPAEPVPTRLRGVGRDPLVDDGPLQFDGCHHHFAPISDGWLL